MLDSLLSRRFGLPWPPGFFWPECPCCPTGSPYDGYWGGGASSVSVSLSSVEGFTFATEATAIVTTAALTAAVQFLCALSNGGDAGYWWLPAANKTVFATDATSAQTTANLSASRNVAAAVSELSAKGYVAGGQTAPGVVFATADQLTFSTDTTAAQTTADLSQARAGHTALGDGSSKGYFMGGRSNVSTAWVATADKLTFSTDTTAASATSNLSFARASPGGLSNGSTAGFANGGNDSLDVYVTSDKVTFATDVTAAQTSSALSTKRAQAIGMSDGADFGWWGGGRSAIGAGQQTNKIDRIAFATEVTSATTSVMQVARGAHAGFSKVGL